MNKFLLRAGSVLLISVLTLFVSCKDGGDGKEKKGTAAHSKKKGGRLADRVNIVQIPLTAGELGLKGKVKDVKYREYMLIPRDGGIMKRLLTSGHNIYDAKGNLIDQVEYEGEDWQKWKCTYSYDADGKRREWHFIFHESHTESKYTFEYGETGNLTAMNEMNETGKVLHRTEYTYDEQGNITEERLLDGKGNIERIETSTYDKDNNQVESVFKNSDGTISYRRTAVYDANGFKLSGIEYRGDSLDSRWECKNNPEGKPLEMIIYNKEGKVISKTTYKYDNMGSEIEIREESDGKTYTGTSTFEYDKKGNVIRRTDYEMKDGKPVATILVETTYTYHP